MAAMRSKWDPRDPGLTGLLATKLRKQAAVALANKLARIAWAPMARGEISARRQPRPERHRIIAAQHQDRVRGGRRVMAISVSRQTERNRFCVLGQRDPMPTIRPRSSVYIRACGPCTAIQGRTDDHNPAAPRHTQMILASRGPSTHGAQIPGKCGHCKMAKSEVRSMNSGLFTDVQLLQAVRTIVAGCMHCGLNQEEAISGNTIQNGINASERITYPIPNWQRIPPQGHPRRQISWKVPAVPIVSEG